MIWVVHSGHACGFVELMTPNKPHPETGSKVELLESGKGPAEIQRLYALTTISSELASISGLLTYRPLPLFNRFRLVQSIPYLKHKSLPIPSHTFKNEPVSSNIKLAEKVVQSNFLYHSQDFVNGAPQDSEPTHAPSCQYPPVCLKITKRKGLPRFFP